MTLTLLFSLAAYAFLCFSADILCEMKKLFSFLWEALLISFLLRCRRWQKQDHLTFRIKELTAFGIAKLFGRSLKEKHMWLVYEKFCITAQVKRFLFF